MSKKNLAVSILFWFAMPVLVLAQKNEVSLSVGGIFTGDQRAVTTFPTLLPCPVTNPTCNVFSTSFQTDPGVGLEGSYARRIVGSGPTSLYLELPVVGVPGRDLRTTFTNNGFQGSSTLSTWSLFFTPSAKVKFLESSVVSPFVTVGGGLAHSARPRSSINKGALQFGGGLDFKTPIPRLRIRAEVRDFYAASFAESSSLTRVSPERLHNVFAAGGAVVRF
jgi:hypothetical protein